MMLLPAGLCSLDGLAPHAQAAVCWPSNTREEYVCPNLSVAMPGTLGTFLAVMLTSSRVFTGPWVLHTLCSQPGLSQGPLRVSRSMEAEAFSWPASLPSPALGPPSRCVSGQVSWTPPVWGLQPLVVAEEASGLAGAGRGGQSLSTAPGS